MMFVTLVAVELKANEMPFYFLLLIPTASIVATGLGKGRGGGQSNSRRCQTKGWVRLATKGLLKWGEKNSA